MEGGVSLTEVSKDKDTVLSVTSAFVPNDPLPRSQFLLLSCTSCD